MNGYYTFQEVKTLFASYGRKVNKTTWSNWVLRYGITPQKDGKRWVYPCSEVHEVVEIKVKTSSNGRKVE